MAADEVFQALSDPTRREVLSLVAQGRAHTATELAAALPVTRQAVAKHLDVLEDVGFEFVDVDVRPRTLKFENGRAVFEDPITRLLLLPEFKLNIAQGELTGPFDYVRETIDKYWSDGTFELTVNVGVVTGRRKA